LFVYVVGWLWDFAWRNEEKRRKKWRNGENNEETDEMMDKPRSPRGNSSKTFWRFGEFALVACFWSRCLIGLWRCLIGLWRA
jgi:hypothetical protein